MLNKKVSVLVLSLLSTFVINISSPVYAESKIYEAKIVTVNGEAAIIESIDTAEKLAISEALRNAVEQATGVYILSETKTKNFQTLSDEIYTNAAGYVSNYEVISKEKRKDTIWVKVKATVSLEPLVESLKKLGLLRKWTIAVIIPKNTDNANYAETALTTLNDAVIDSGFRVVDQDVIASLETPKILAQINSGNYLSASKLLRDNGVDVLIIGKPYTQDMAAYNDNSYGVNVSLNTAKGHLDTKVVRCDTAELLASKSFEATGVGAGQEPKIQSIKNSSIEAGKYLVGQIMKLPASTSAHIQLSIKNISFIKAKSIIEALKRVRGISKVTSRGYRNKEALYEIETNGDVNLLTDNMSENTKLIKLFKLEIISVSSGKIEASVNN